MTGAVWPCGAWLVSLPGHFLGCVLGHQGQLLAKHPQPAGLRVGEKGNSHVLGLAEPQLCAPKQGCSPSLWFWVLPSHLWTCFGGLQALCGFNGQGYTEELNPICLLLPPFRAF